MTVQTEQTAKTSSRETEFSKKVFNFSRDQTRERLPWGRMAQRREGLPARTGRIERQREYNRKGGDNWVTEKSFMTVEEVAEELRVSKSKAYEIVRQLNAELKQKGYLTVAGRVNTRFFQKKTCYSE